VASTLESRAERVVHRIADFESVEQVLRFSGPRAKSAIPVPNFAYLQESLTPCRKSAKTMPEACTSRARVPEKTQYLLDGFEIGDPT